MYFWMICFFSIYVVSSTIENIDQYSESVMTELNTLIGETAIYLSTLLYCTLSTLTLLLLHHLYTSDMFHPNEKNYDLKINKVQSVIEMIHLKFQSLNLYYVGEVDDMHSQLHNR